MGSGALIVFEGLDGCGKTTQLDLLRKWLKGKGYRVFATEWHASVDVKKALAKGSARRRALSPITSNLLHAMDFADRYLWQILPRLQNDYVILCDRYIYTALARGVVRGCVREWLEGVYSFAAKPLTTFYLSVSPEIALQRILRDRPSMKYFESGMDLGLSQDVSESFIRFQTRVCEQYNALAGKYQFVSINGDQTSKTIAEQVLQRVQIEISLHHLPMPKEES